MIRDSCDAVFISENHTSALCTLAKGHTGLHASAVSYPVKAKPAPVAPSFDGLIERINGIQSHKAMRPGKVPEPVFEAVTAARERGISYVLIYETIGDEWFKNAESFATSHRAYVRRKKIMENLPSE